MLKNRFYIGEVVYRGEVHAGEHQAILDKDLFEAVQAKLRDQAVTRKLARRQSPRLLTGKLFDDAGNLMSPTHANKKGVRYRYYTSQALLQGRPSDAGSVARVAATEVERLVVDALRAERGDQSAPCIDRDLFDQHLIRTTIRKDCIEVVLMSADGEIDPDASTSIMTIPFQPVTIPKKGILHGADSVGLTATDRTTILTAIARSKAWIQTITQDPNGTFETIAAREGRSARYIKLLAPLAYVSPRLIEALTEGRPSPI